MHESRQRLTLQDTDQNTFFFPFRTFRLPRARKVEAKETDTRWQQHWQQRQRVTP
jgi:hypothetical protein